MEYQLYYFYMLSSRPIYADLEPVNIFVAQLSFSRFYAAHPNR